MKNVAQIILAVLIALVIQSFVFFHLLSPQNSSGGNKEESAYDRVIRTGVLRCAYGTWEPCVMRDGNTGKFSGIVYDFMQEVGKVTNLKIEYSLEVPWDSIGVALHGGKADAHCAGVCATPARGRVMAFSHPLFFAPITAFCRTDDHRFDNNLERINQPDVTVALSDDDITTEIYKTDFPRAKTITLPQFAPPEELFLAIATNKADVTISGPSRLPSFDKSYPGKVKVIPTKVPLRVLSNTIAVDIGEEKLLHVLNTAVDQLVMNGAMDKLIAKYKTKYNMDFLIPVNRSYAWKRD